MEMKAFKVIVNQNTACSHNAVVLVNLPISYSLFVFLNELDFDT